MDKYVIHGGKRLFGEITISGAKNAAVAIIPAAVLIDGTCRIENIPRVNDVFIQLEILRELGASINFVNPSTVEINCSNLRNFSAVSDLNRRVRASYYFIGALLSRFRRADVAMPGGCNFGSVRPIDQHIKAFEALGAEVSIKNATIHCKAQNGLTGTSVYMDVVSVGATINAVLAATLAEGMTVIENSAKEPHVVDLANFLNSMGADIMGAGTDVIKVRGVEKLQSGSYSIIPDQIEAGTCMAAVAATGGSVLLKNVIPKHLDCITAKLHELGATVEEGDDTIRITRDGDINKINLKTLPYPGFPTDMQPQLSAVLCTAKGTSIVTEGVWDNRYRYIDELRRMGAQVQVDGKVAIIEGIEALSGAPVCACDLRAGAAMVIAGLSANGVTEIEGIYHIERGYENLVEKLQKVGADIQRVTVEDSETESAAV